LGGKVNYQVILFTSGKNVIDISTLQSKLISRLEDNPTLQDKLIVGLSPSVGLVLGLVIVAILPCVERMKKLVSILFLMAAANILSGSFTLAFYEHMKKIGILTFYGLLYGSTSGKL